MFADFVSAMVTIPTFDNGFETAFEMAILKFSYSRVMHSIFPDHSYAHQNLHDLLLVFPGLDYVTSS